MAERKYEQRLVTANSFDDTGTFREAGHIGLFLAKNLEDEEAKEKPSEHLKTVDDFEVPVVEMAAVGPTGPNPKNPQQIPPDGGQGAGGGYIMPGKVLVGEVTKGQEERLAPITEPEVEAEADERLKEALLSGDANIDNTLVEGTVADVTADLGGKTDDELASIRAQEVDREKPRKGVISAIDAELASRKENA